MVLEYGDIDLARLLQVGGPHAALRVHWLHWDEIGEQARSCAAASLVMGACHLQSRALCSTPLDPQKHEKARRELAGGEVEDIDENFIRLYWEQMLQARAAAQGGLGMAARSVT